MAIYTYFSVRGQTVNLEMPPALYDRVFKLAGYLRVTRCDILSSACAQYGVSIEAVEKYLNHDMKEEMRIAENFEL